MNLLRFTGQIQYLSQLLLPSRDAILTDSELTNLINPENLEPEPLILREILVSMIGLYILSKDKTRDFIKIRGFINGNTAVIESPSQQSTLGNEVKSAPSQPRKLTNQAIIKTAIKYYGTTLDDERGIDSLLINNLSIGTKKLRDFIEELNKSDCKPEFVEYIKGRLKSLSIIGTSTTPDPKSQPRQSSQNSNPQGKLESLNIIPGDASTAPDPESQPRQSSQNNNPHNIKPAAFYTTPTQQPTAPPAPSHMTSDSLPQNTPRASRFHPAPQKAGAKKADAPNTNFTAKRFHSAAQIQSKPQP